jgi:hypothetical protein
MGDIGPVRRRIDFEPMPETIPMAEPSPEIAPSTAPAETPERELEPV